MNPLHASSKSLHVYPSLVRPHSVILGTQRSSEAPEFVLKALSRYFFVMTSLGALGLPFSQLMLQQCRHATRLGILFCHAPPGLVSRRVSLGKMSQAVAPAAILPMAVERGLGTSCEHSSWPTVNTVPYKLASRISVRTSR